jgi:tetratricopeptide (TPR) repeat protein
LFACLFVDSRVNQPDARSVYADNEHVAACHFCFQSMIGIKKFKAGTFVISRMTRLILKAVAVGLIITGVHSCGSSESKAPDPFRTLSYPPFDGITDSIRRSPENPELYLRRAVALSQNNLQELATPDYKKAWELTNDAGIELEYISNLLLTNHVTEGLELLKQGTEKFPSNTEFNRRLGEVYLQRNEPDSAMAQFNTIINKDSSNFEAWYDRGTLLAKLKDTAGD